MKPYEIQLNISKIPKDKIYAVDNGDFHAKMLDLVFLKKDEPEHKVNSRDGTRSKWSHGFIAVSTEQGEEKGPILGDVCSWEDNEPQKQQPAPAPGAHDDFFGDEDSAIPF